MVMHGKGTLKYSETHYYKGLFSNGVKEGYGTFVNGLLKYIGNFSQNKKNGYGILNLEDGSKFSGEFINDKYYGKGELI